MSKIRTVYLDRMREHPMNREFPRSGEEWGEFVESIRTRGVMQTVIVRYLGDTVYEILSGHRRVAAALEAGMEKLICDVRELDDREALLFLTVANFNHLDLDPVQEAVLVEGLLAVDFSEDDLQRELKKSLDWIRNRQGLLALGDEVCAAVRLPKDDERHLHLETVQMLLGLEGEERQMALSLVLHPELEEGTLNVRQARDTIRQMIVEPRRKRQEWEKGSKELVKAWRAGLAELLTGDEAKCLVVQAVAWDEAETTKARRPAMDAVETHPQAVAAMVEGKTWLHLALRHGLPVWVVPADGEARSAAVVDEALLVLAERAREEHGLDCWIQKRTSNIERPTSNAEGKKGEEADIPGFLRRDATATGTGNDAVQDALHVLEGQGERGFQEEEKAETVIEQRVESSAWVDLMPVRRMREWAVANYMPLHPLDHVECSDDSVPQVFKVLSPAEMLDICDWFLSLKQGAGK